MKFITFVFSFMIFSQAWATVNSSGCLVKIGKKIVVDPQCKCLEKKLCVTPKKFTASKVFFETRDENNNKLFSSQEKKYYEETYNLMNKIMELKAQGKGNSPEIKNHYFQLDKLNSDLAISLHKNHSRVMASLNKRNNENSKKRKEKNDQREARIKDFFNNKKTIASNSNLVNKSNSNVINVKSSDSVIAPPSVATVPQVEIKEGELSQSEKKFILQNVKNGNYESNQDDSLFEIISKAYKTKAYKKLLDSEQP